MPLGLVVEWPAAVVLPTDWQLGLHIQLVQLGSVFLGVSYTVLAPIGAGGGYSSWVL